MQSSTKQKIQYENKNLMTSCHKGGVKIKHTKNEYTTDPFAEIKPFSHVNEDNKKNVYNKLSYENLDLNIENYSREELFNLFGLKNISLSEDVLKECKKLLFKTHPDKCHLDAKYFIFFSKAYEIILSIYEFQNKTKKSTILDTNDYFDNENAKILQKVFETKKELTEDSNKFNLWFNEQYNTHKLEDPNEIGYGSWLKSDDDIFTSNVSKANMASEIEKRKKQVQSLITYNGINDSYASTFGGSSLMVYNNNFTSNSLFSNEGIGFTDLRQAYVESVIPVTEEDYNKIKQFKNFTEYKNHRNSIDTQPLSKEEGMRILFNKDDSKDKESVALAFYYAQQSEKIKQKQNNFWSSLKQITN